MNIKNLLVFLSILVFTKQAFGNEYINYIRSNVYIIDYVLIVALIITIICLFWYQKKIKKDYQNTINSINNSLIQSKREYETLKQSAKYELNKHILKLDDMVKVHASTVQDMQNSMHDVVKVVADRVSFMEVTLSRMDKTVPGTKQLIRSISQIKDNLQAQGYEIIPMLGKTFYNGMNAEVSFLLDETMDKGVQIVTNVMKPQINYHGIMIQQAKITVTHND